VAQAYKRRLIPIVDRRFQFKYTGIVLSVAASVSLVLGYLLWQSYIEMNEVVDLASLSPEVSDKLNTDDTRFVFQLTIVVLATSVLVFGLMGLIITHRVVGPIFVLQRHLQSILDGKYPHTRPLRDGDEFGEAFTTFRAVVDHLRKRDEDEVGKLSAAVAAAKSQGLPAEHVAALEKMVDERNTRLSNKATMPPTAA
jgi:nitrogen fixation/metabolism regulation signal transduction histidine kinase